MQNSVNHRDFERIWHFQVPPGSMFLRVEFPTHLGASLPSQGVRVRTGVGLWRGVLSHERAAALAEVGECGARLGCLSRRSEVCLQTDDRGSRRRASGFLAATVAGGLGAPFALYGNACASHFHRRSVGPPKEHTLARVELSPSNGARLPAELKHITKRRKRNQQGCP